MSDHVLHRDAIDLIAELDLEDTWDVELRAVSVDPEAKLDVTPVVASEVILLFRVPNGVDNLLILLPRAARQANVWVCGLE